MRLMQWIFGVCLFTSSCDLILNFNIGGSLRLAQLLMVLVCFAALARVMQEGRILWPRGSTCLMLWVFAQLLFIPFSGNVSIGIQFFAVLVFTVAGVFAVVQLYGRSNFIEPLMRIYMLSFVFVALFGLVQFAMPLLGLPGPLVTQWIIHGRVARINGFCYEPSYFATYLLMGWIMVIELRISKASIATGRVWKFAVILITAALILCTSKTAWAFMFLELLARVVPPAWHSVRHSAAQLPQGRFILPVPRARTVAAAVVVLGLLGAGATITFRYIDPLTFLAGTGIAGTPAHSVDERNRDAQSTWAAFKDHPFVGRSLGGVPVYLAQQDGVNITDRDVLRLYWGFPVPLDVLAASGIIGFIPFVLFVWANTFSAMRLARRRWPEERAKWLRALARAMIYEWMLLMVDQNLLRVYVWFHITMVAVVAYHLEFSPAPEAAPSAIPQLPSGFEEASVAL